MRDGHFVQRLESLRGVAALMVAASHALYVLPPGRQAGTAWWLGFLGNGYAAVTLFFVLSGFVLGLAIKRAEGKFAPEFWRYAMRRFWRIYPAFFFTTILVLTWLFAAAALYPGQAIWFNHVLQSHHGILNSEMAVSPSVVVKTLLLQDPSLNLVTWTLKAEMACSLLLPLLHCLVHRMSMRGKFLVLLGLVFLACAEKWLLLLGSPRAEALIHGHVLKYLFLFYLGYLLPDAGPALLGKLKRHRLWNRVVLALGSMVFLCSDAISSGGAGEDLRIVQGLAAWVVLAGLLYGTDFLFFSVLDHPIAKFYGAISYSFYLLHDLTLVVVSRFFVHFVPATVWSGAPLLFAGLLLVVSVLVATPLAGASYRFIEKPFIRFSKRMWPHSAAVTELPVPGQRLAA